MADSKPLTQKQIIWLQLLKWFLFAVLLSLIPLGADALRDMADGQDLNWHHLLGRGQLLLLAVAISGAAMGEIIFCRKGFHLARILAGSACFLTFLCSTLAYPMAAQEEPVLPKPSQIANDPKTQPSDSEKKGSKDHREDLMYTVSVILFIGSLVSGGFCVLSLEL